jgi:hypothetical protein
MQARVASVIVVSVVAACVVVGALAVVFGLGSSLPQTPDELFERICKYQLAGETGKIWDLLTDEGRRQQIEGFEAHRRLLTRNNDPNETLTRNNFNCTREEFLRMSNVQVFISENRGRERALVDAKIVERHTDPKSPDDMYLMIDTPTGVRVTMHVKHVDGGWRWVDNSVRQMK